MAEAKKTIKKSTKQEKEQLEEILAVDKEVVAKKSEEVTKEAEAEAKLAKAGKRSSKAIKEAEEKEAKQERKLTSAKSDDSKPKMAQKPPRSRAERAGKKYQELAKQIDRTKNYSAPDALGLAIKTSPTKFDATIELHVNLAVDPTQADQNIRGTVALPSGTGKTVRVAVFAEAADAKKATEAGADKTGSDDFLAELDNEAIDFDILITTPSMMPKLAKYARLLGPKGLMPNPKSGTVTPDVAKAVLEAKAGRLEFRVDSAGILHMPIGKVSFGEAKLQTNLDAVMASVRAAKPASVKGIFIKSAYLSSSMGPSVKLDI